MAATQPNLLFNRLDDNLFNHINNLQDQIGDLFVDLITDYGDFFELDDSLFDDNISDYDLVKTFEYFKNKLITKANKYSIIFPGIEDIGGGQIRINVNGPVMRHDGNGQITSIPIKAGDKFLISNTNSLYDNTELNYYTVASVDNPVSPNAIIINETFIGNFATLPIGNLIFLDGSAGRILQHGVELLPAGSILPIFGTFQTINETNGNILGLNSCPPGYQECNGSLIENENSIFDQKYIIDLRGLFINGINKGINITLNNGYSGNIGAIQGTDVHFHRLNNHVHSFQHEHDHDHTFNHTHTIREHRHIANHKHIGIKEHNHFTINDVPTTGREKIKDSVDNSSMEYDDIGDNGHYNHVHEMDATVSQTSFKFDYSASIQNTNALSNRSSEANTGLNSANILFNGGSDIMTTDPNYDTNIHSINNFTNMNFSLPKFKSVKFCMKL